MLKFRKFSFLYEESNEDDDYGKYGFYGKIKLQNKTEKYWDMEHTLTKGGWTFTVPALGGNNAKEKHDIIIKHEGYFNSPINIELKTNISGLAYSTHAQELYNEHIGEKNSPDRTSAGQSREYYGTSIMQDYLKGENIDIEGNSPIDVLIKYREHIQKKNEEGETVHHPPVSTNILNAIEKKWRDDKIDGVFMSHRDAVDMDHKKDDKRHKTSKHFDDSENIKPPKPYRKVYAQIHDLIDRTLEWKPKTESETENSEPHSDNKNHRVWSTKENSDDTISAGNMHISVIRGQGYTRAKHTTEDGSEYHYFIRDNIPEGQRHEYLLGKWGKNKNSTIYKKEGGNYIIGNFNDEGKFIPNEDKKEARNEEEVERRYSNIKKRSDSIGLGSSSFSHIKSGYDVNSPRHIYHQFLDEMFQNNGKGQKTINEDLRRWFKEKWTAQDGSKCGDYKGKGRVKCRPSKRVSGKSPQTWGEMSGHEKKKAVKLKQKAHKKGHQFSSHSSGKTWKGDKYKHRLKKGKNKSMNESFLEFMEFLSEANKPTNPKLWSKCKSAAKRKFDVYPSAYSNAWAAKCYKGKRKGKGSGWKASNK